MKMVTASSSEKREQIINQDGIIIHNSAIFNVYFNICTSIEHTIITDDDCHHIPDIICVLDTHSTILYDLCTQR